MTEDEMDKESGKHVE